MIAESQYFAFDDEKGWGRSLVEASRGEFKLFRTVSEVPENALGIFYRMQQKHLSRDRQAVNLLDKKTVQMVVRPIEAELKDDKKAQLSYLASYMPRTYFLTSAADAVQALDGIDLPFISKSIHGSGSKNVRLLKSMDEANHEIECAFGAGIDIAGSIEKQKGYLYWQKFIAGNEGDWRVIVVAKTFGFIIRRYNRDDVPFASGSGLVEPVTDLRSIHKQMLDLCMEIARKHDLSMCGLDIVLADGGPVICHIPHDYTAVS